MFFVVIPVIIFIVLYAHRYYSDDTSAIELLRTDNAHDEEKEEEIPERKSRKSEVIEKCF